VLFDVIANYRTSVLVIASVVLIGLGSGITHLEVTTDNRIFYGPQNRYFQDFLAFEAEFSPNDNILFVINAPFSVTENEYPEAIRWLTSQAFTLSHVIRVDSLSTYPHPWTDGDELIVEPLLDWACPSNECIHDLVSAATESRLTNRLVSPDGTSTGVIATVSIERGAIGSIEALYAEIESLAEAFQQRFPNIAVHYTGGIPMMAAFALASADDLVILLPAALAVISALIFLVVGSIRLAAIVLTIGLASIVATLGIAGWLGLTLNNATTIVPLVVLTLVVTSSMHVVVHFSRNLGSHPPTLRGAKDQARASLTSSITPVTLSAATSIASLCSLWLVDSPPIRQLGLLSATGVGIGCMSTLVVLPLLLMRITRVSETRMIRWIQASLNRYARSVESGRARSIAPFVIFVAFSTGALTLQINDDFVKFFDESTDFRYHTDKATSLLAGPNHIEVLLTNPDGTVFDSDFLSYLARAGEFVRSFPNVRSVHSFANVMRDIAAAFDEGLALSESTEEHLAQLFLIYELSLQLGQSNTDLINRHQDTARASVLLSETTSSDIQSLESEIYAWHATNGSGFDLKVTGENIPVAHLSRMNISAMLVGILGSLIFTAMVLGIAFRSYRLSAVALTATLVPVAAGFGIWAIAVGEIGLAATGVIALTIGVVVDDAAHFIYRFLDAQRRLGLGAWPAAAYSIHRVGAAIVSSSVVLAAGLSLLVLSTFQVNSTFGAVASLIIVTALAFGLFVMPGLSVWATTNRVSK
jgi:uncharacterized protein